MFFFFPLQIITNLGQNLAIFGKKNIYLNKYNFFYLT